jgi:hypothetical protein
MLLTHLLGLLHRLERGVTQVPVAQVAKDQQRE